MQLIFDSVLDANVADETLQDCRDVHGAQPYQVYGYSNQGELWHRYPGPAQAAARSCRPWGGTHRKEWCSGCSTRDTLRRHGWSGISGWRGTRTPHRQQTPLAGQCSQQELASSPGGPPWTLPACTSCSRRTGSWHLNQVCLLPVLHAPLFDKRQVIEVDVQARRTISILCLFSSAGTR
jgi:hypothetical protein